MATTETGDNAPAIGLDTWRRLSPWSMVQFSLRALVQHVRALIIGAPAMLGAVRSERPFLAGLVPAILVVLVIGTAILSYVFYRFRLGEYSIQVRQGALRRKHLDLAFERIQNISIEEPIYYRPLGLVTLKIDGAGSSGEEVRLMAVERGIAESMRSFIRHRKAAATDEGRTEGENAQGQVAEDGAELRLTRSLGDLVIHGLTNNRAFIAIAGIFAFLSQANITPADIVQRLGIDFDVIVAGMSMVRLTLLFIVSLLFVVGLFALLSVLVSIFVYYGFSLYRSDKSLIVRRGLLTRHEIHVDKSRIQSISLRQDWLDFILGRRNILLEPISHTAQAGSGASAAAGKRILVPSVRLHETNIVTDEILPLRIEELAFSPASRRYFRKYLSIFSCLYAAAMICWALSPLPGWIAAAILVLWPFHGFLLYMRWKRKGLAVDADTLVVRGGTIGINYTIFQAHKIQDVSHLQSILMRRRRVSTLVFHTASTTARAPYLDSAFAKSVVNFALLRVEAGQRSWM